MKSLCFLLLIGLTASFVSANDDIETQKACVKELEHELRWVVITDAIWPLMKVFKDFYPKETYEQMPYLASVEVQTALMDLPYPKDCDTYLETFEKADGKAKCLEKVNFDEMFRWMMGHNRLVDTRIGASHACQLSRTLHGK